VSINLFGDRNRALAKAAVSVVAIVQALTSYLAHRSTPGGRSLIERGLKKMT
jgi:hypothetical protein